MMVEPQPQQQIQKIKLKYGTPHVADKQFAKTDFGDANEIFRSEYYRTTSQNQQRPEYSLSLQKDAEKSSTPIPMPRTKLSQDKNVLYNSASKSKLGQHKNSVKPPTKKIGLSYAKQDKT